MAEVKAAGKYRQEGKTYIVQDGDIIHFQFNVSGLINSLLHIVLRPLMNARQVSGAKKK